MEINLAIIDFNPGQGGGVKPSGTLDISENGVYNVYNYASASVDVHPSASLSETYISNGSYNITGEFNGGVITVDVPATQFITETLSVSANGTYTPSEGIDGYSQVVVDVPQSVTGFTEKDITEGTVEIINLDNTASFVASNAFKNNINIQTVNLPYATSVGNSAFYYCTSLSQVNLPVCSYIGGGAFQNCSSLNQVSLPVCSYISEYAFYGCSSLNQVRLPMCIDIGSYAFKVCSALEKIDLPKCYKLSDSAFQNCPSLSQVSLPRVLRINPDTFEYCVEIQQMTLPLCSYIDRYAFAGNWNASMKLQSLYLPLCNTLYNNALGTKYLSDLSVPMCISFYANLIENSVISTLSLPIVNYLSNNIFSNCTNLTSLTLGTGTYLIPSYNTNMLYNTPIMSGTGSIYVDAAMYDKWITTEGWSSLSERFVSIGNTDPMLSFSDGLVYGKTSYIEDNFLTYLGIDYNSTISMSLPNCIICKNFNYLDNLQSLYLPECQYVEKLISCSTLSIIDLPKCKVIKELKDCPFLTSINLPMCECLFGFYNFEGCYKLTSINLPVCNYMESIGEVGGNCSLTLGSNEVCYLSGTLHTNITSIYVPASLVDAYKSAENWSYYSTQIFPIE